MLPLKEMNCPLLSKKIINETLVSLRNLSLQKPEDLFMFTFVLVKHVSAFDCPVIVSAC